MRIPSFVVFLLVISLSYESDECRKVCSCKNVIVDCSDKNLDVAPLDMPLTVEIMYFRGNRLNETSLSQVLAKHESLTELYLDRSSLYNIPIKATASNLKTLSLTHNSIETIEEEFWSYVPNLVSLNLSHNLIQILTSEMFPSTNLLVLNLNNNKIKLIMNGAFDQLKNLTELRLSHNSLNSLGKSIHMLKNLRYLELNRNNISTIDGLTFKNLIKLGVLQIRQNSLSVLGDGAFYGAANMTVLRLENNNVRNVTPGWLYGLNKLQELYLGSNMIKVIPKDAWNVEPRESLRLLDLSHNHLHEIKFSTFEHLAHLRRLRLGHNKISMIDEGAFKSTPHLIELNLSKNNISWIIEDMGGAFVGLDHLRKLNLSANRITSISNKAFIGLTSLTELDLSLNNIQSIQENSFLFTSLKNLVMQTNTLLCDCNLAWLPTWIRKSSVDKVNGTCEYPDSLKDMNIMTIGPKDFECSKNSPKPVITQVPKSVVTLAGKKVEFHCSASSSVNSSLNFKWKLGHNKAIKRKGNVVNNTATLVISPVTLQDAGKYQCIVSNNFGTTYSPQANLTVLELPKMIKTPANITIKSGKTVKFQCAASGSPQPQVGWQKDGGIEFPAAQERRMHVMPSDDAFFIVSTKPADSGVYSCTAKNSAGVVYANATLSVLEAPAFTKKMEDKDVELGKSAVLECMATGWPKPKIRWTKDGSPLARTSRYHFSAEDQLLVIVDIKLSDVGEYQCEVTNSLGIMRGKSHLSISQLYSPNEDFTGVIIITGVCCAVGTSAIWVIIIYHTQKRFRRAIRTKTANKIHLDIKSEHSASSKDSGTGDSTKRSTEDLRMGQNSCMHDVGAESELRVSLLNMFSTIHPDPSSSARSCLNSSSQKRNRENNYTRQERSGRPCSIPLSKSSVSLHNSSQHTSSYLCLYPSSSSKPTEL